MHRFIQDKPYSRSSHRRGGDLRIPCATLDASEKYASAQLGSKIALPVPNRSRKSARTGTINILARFISSDSAVMFGTSRRLARFCCNARFTELSSEIPSTGLVKVARPSFIALTANGMSPRPVMKMIGIRHLLHGYNLPVRPPRFMMPTPKSQVAQCRQGGCRRGRDYRRAMRTESRTPWTRASGLAEYYCLFGT